VVIPAGNIGGVVAAHGVASGDEVLYRFVESVSHVDRAVTERRAVMEIEAGMSLVFLEHLVVDVDLLPVLEHIGLTHGQTRAHGEAALGHVQCFLVLHFVSPYMMNFQDFILYLQDIVASNPLFNIQKLRKQFDDIFSYDQHDATQYNLHYLPTPYSALPELLNNTSISYDMFFCGNAKNRLSEIMAVYYSATNAGLSCLFYINDVPKKHQQHLPGIIYNHTISYNDCVKKTIYAKCIVEIMQHGADGYTPRLWEAITYNKHLLTNNQFIESSPFAHPCIHYFTSEIDWSWINTKASYPTEWHIKLSPIQCLTQIEKYL